MDELLPYIIPCKLIEHTIYQLFDSTSIIDVIFYGENYHSDSVQCFLALESTLTLYWKSSYNEYSITSAILYGLRTQKSTKWLS